jgi:3,4-dihydroxy 2-butanone 4-phosphate synthase/GTP cyclohydrolase II
MPVCTIDEALADIRAGKFVILVDDENRENEGDLAIAAEKVSAEAINFMAREGRGLVCLTLTEAKCAVLNLSLQAPENTAKFGTPFTVSVDAAHGVTTGISAADRAHTIKAAIRDDARPSDLARPGHIFPLRARDGGVLVRAGQTEGSVDLARIAGLKPSGVICEIMNADGTMARMPDLEKFAAKHGLKIATIADLIKYRRQRESVVECTEIVDLPTKYGKFRLHQYEDKWGGLTHLALTMGALGRPEPDVPAAVQDGAVLVRVHDQCLTGDTFGSTRCDCGAQLDKSLMMIAAEGKGALVYMRQEGRGIGLENKLHAYALQDKAGLDTVEANVVLGFHPDLREYGIGAQILTDLGIRKLRLLTNNPRKIVALEGYNLEIVERLPISIPPGPDNRKYIETKRNKMGHLM